MTPTEARDHRCDQCHVAGRFPRYQRQSDPGRTYAIVRLCATCFDHSDRAPLPQLVCLDAGFASCAGRPNQLPGRPCAICGCMEHAETAREPGA